MLGEIVASADDSLGYKLCYSLDVFGEVVSESACNLGGRVVESESEFNLLVGIGSHRVEVVGYSDGRF